MMKKGCIQVYYGPGKGKTTAALGQGLRAVGHGLTVFMVQFLKTSTSGETEAIRRLEPEFRLFRFERPHGFFWTLGEEEKEELRQDTQSAMHFIRKVLKNRQCDVLILDEILGAVEKEVITSGQVEELLKERPEGMEIILTGRVLTDSLRRYADYIIEMRAEKHPYDAGLAAREGIEF